MTRFPCHSRDDLTSLDSMNVWQALFDSVTDPIFVHDADMRIIRANLAYSQHAGMPIDELLGRPYWQVFPKHDGPIASCIHAREDGEQKDEEFTLENGKTFTSSAFPIKDECGLTHYSLHIMKDVSDHKRAEIALQLGAQVFLHSTEGMMVTDADNIILAVNPAFTRITGYSEEEALGKTPRILHSGQQDKAFYQAMWHALQHDGHWRGEIRNRRKDGALYTESLVINTIYNPDGTVSRRIALFSNITEKKNWKSKSGIRPISTA
jgi:PAS domain S-box